MPQNLTARFVETVKPKPGERATISDSVVEGLELRLGTNGSKTWSLRYRTKGGKRSRVSLGRYPVLSLAEARDRAIQALAAAVSGADPALEKKIEKIEAIAAERTVEDLANAFFASPEAALRTPQTNVMESGVWRNHLAPKLAKRPLHRLTRGEVRAAVRQPDRQLCPGGAAPDLQFRDPGGVGGGQPRSFPEALPAQIPRPRPDRSGNPPALANLDGGEDRRKAGCVRTCRDRPPALPYDPAAGRRSDRHAYG
jgi:hypothetical protein